MIHTTNRTVVMSAVCLTLFTASFAQAWNLPLVGELSPETVAQLQELGTKVSAAVLPYMGTQRLQGTPFFDANMIPFKLTQRRVKEENGPIATVKGARVLHTDLGLRMNDEGTTLQKLRSLKVSVDLSAEDVVLTYAGYRVVKYLLSSLAARNAKQN